MGYPKEVYQAVEEQFSSFRFDAENKQITRKKEAFRAVPRLQEIEKELTALGLMLIKKAFTAENTEELMENSRKNAEILQAEQQKLLFENGFASDYLEPRYRCSVCQDKGHTDLGYCDCFKDALLKEAFKQSNLPLMMDTQSFDTFRLDVYPEDARENMEDVLKICKNFADSFNENNGESLFLYGGTGLGKTFLSSCIAKAVLEQGHDVFYQPAYKIFRMFESYKFNHEDKALSKSHIDRIMDAELLIIDDLGAEMVTAYTAEVLFDLINTRTNKRQPTIISTNLDFNDLETVYSQRITSRILGNYIILECTGDDIREL
ncbi:MAG: ATP-binding protein [Clostridia bacterium]|nr:ATP-binding protein [Clostridia bacterium]